MKKFGLGDVVQLKSGGPAMTITNVLTDSYVCQFIYKGEIKGLQFAEEALEIFVKERLPNYADELIWGWWDG